MDIEILSINELLSKKYLFGSLYIAIVFVTEKPNYYNFGCTPFHIVDIPDSSNAKGVNKIIVEDINCFIDEIKDVDILYICCDAGLCRSPAIALYVCERLGLDDVCKTIKRKYRFLNYSIYKKLKDINKELNENEKHNS